MNPTTIKLHPNDNVAVAVKTLPAGSDAGTAGVTTETPVPAGHKVAQARIDIDQPIRKYNQIIGFASKTILPGQHVHSHNVTLRDFERDYAFGKDVKIPEEVEQQATFEGFLRPDGRAGTRNYIGVLTSVNCSATVAKYIGAAFDKEGETDLGNLDGVVAFTHGTGCGMNQGNGLALLRRTMAGYAAHPNLAAVLVVGLGCEVNQIPDWLKEAGLEAGPQLRTMVIQESGGTRKTVERGVSMVREMIPDFKSIQRQTVPASHLTLGLECGGSDAYSGITANPSLGAAADLLVRHGGTAILSETPEIYGAEHLLTRRAVSEKVGRKIVDLIQWWEDYTMRNKAEMNNNPSPGNKAGGLTTILEKSLGAVAKGGTSPLQQVYQYAETVKSKGFVFMDSPGYDPVSVTGQVAAGANVVCFTTGRGSVFGCKPAPSLKLATNSTMYRHIEEDMDVNCGEVLDGGKSVQQMGEEIFQLILDTASGKPSKREAQGFGDHEFLPWQMGAVM